MTPQTPPQRRPVRLAAVVIVVLLVLGGLLALDLANHGLVWQTFWSLTGEESPLAQIRGMVEVAGTYLRPQPQTEPLAAIANVGVNPYGINTFLQQEVEVPKIEEELRMIKAAGFAWIRQEFPWEDIEVDGRGQFTDSRYDYDGDGIPDTISAWDKYDRIVNLVEQYGLQMEVRLSNPPAWSRANPDAGDKAPPDDYQDFVNYAVAVATRYKGRLHYYQVWNEPNIYPEWGNNFVDPAAYTDLLCRTYRALKAVDPSIVVLSGALAPTSALDGYYGYNDFIYLQNMYDSGAKDCFDVMSINGYGLNSGPTDHRMRLTDINYARNIYIRDIMVANGDAAKPIWISEAAWNPVGEPDVSRDISGYATYGITTLDQAARWMPLAYQRAEEDWPWIGVINYWFFTRPSDAESNQSWFYFRMVEPDYSDDKPTFTPLPVYNSMADYIHSHDPVLHLGTHQADDWAITLAGDTTEVEAPGAELGTAAQTSSVSFTAYGTDVTIRWRGDAIMYVTVNGVFQAMGGHCTHPLAEDEWRQNVLAESILPQTYQIEIKAFPDNLPLLVDSITVMDRPVVKLYPIVAPAVALGLFLLWIIVDTLRQRRAS